MVHIRRTPMLLLAILALASAPVAHAQTAAAEPAASASVDLIRGIYQSFATGDVPAVLQKFDAGITWTIPAGLYYGGVYRGPEGVLNGVFMRLATEWDDFRVVPSEFVGHGEHVFVRGTYTGTYKANGQQLEAPFVHVYRVHNGLVAEYHGYTDTALINRVAGK